MADVINLNAEDNRNIIDDDAVPTLTLENTHASGKALLLKPSGGGVGLDLDQTTGTGLDIDLTTGIGVDIDATSGTGVDVDVTTGTAFDGVASTGIAGKFYSSATTGRAIDAGRTVIGSTTIAPVRITASVASGALMEFNSPLVSTASLTVYAGSFPVFQTAEGKVVYIPGYIVA